MKTAKKVPWWEVEIRVRPAEGEWKRLWSGSSPKKRDLEDLVRRGAFNFRSRAELIKIARGARGRRPCANPLKKWCSFRKINRDDLGGGDPKGRGLICRWCRWS